MSKNETEIPRQEKKLNAVAIVMDGNGRWATARHLPRTAGHVAGVKNVKPVLRAFRDIGVHYVTLYAFSTENWKRPKEEVDAIMNLAVQYIDTEVRKTVANDPTFGVRFLGDKSALPPRLAALCTEMEELSRDREFTCAVALNYGGRDEILHAAQCVMQAGEEMTAENFEKHLYTAGMPNPDLMIRTGGELRLSNYLLWQNAYAEFYFTDTLWPDFSEKDILDASESFAGRKRRYGGLDAKEKA